MNGILEKYNELLGIHNADSQRLTRDYNLVGILRFMVFISLAVFLIIYFKKGNIVFLGAFLFATAGFIAIIRAHAKLSFGRKKKRALIEINEAELAYLKKEKIEFYDGSEYIDQKHPFSFDLDFFGKDSIFQNINRTSSYIGKSELARLFLTNFPNQEIKNNQEAVAELAEKLEFRQDINAIGRIVSDSKHFYDSLLDWVNSPQKKPSTLLKYFSFASPGIIVILMALYFIVDIVAFRSAAIGLFLFNIAVLTANLKAIKKEIIGGTKIDKIIKNYSLMINAIEGEDFKSEKLNTLKAKITNGSMPASSQIKKLSSLFSQLDTLFNLIGAFVSNGLALQHIHVYRNLSKWKTDNRENIAQWLGVIGEFEALGSLANFSFNNPSFVFPDLNQDKKIEIQNLGHPLISSGVRVDNTVDFNEQRFIVLTGSNMAGKSTFLRSLGVNMVLAGIGSVICATKANINPFKVWVSMRLSDSLEDNESYFFAEVKRLKEIVDQSEKETTFILLDEILRGTNSEDKHIGTVEVIKKLVAKGAIGAIATHDLKVCKTTDEYPDILINKCFEVEIINDELNFDYKLRPGICKSKNATFLMKKMGVI